MRKAARTVTQVTATRLSVFSKENWHLPTLVAGVMHNIEPAHHALQQGGGEVGEGLGG